MPLTVCLTVINEASSAIFLFNLQFLRNPEQSTLGWIDLNTFWVLWLSHWMGELWFHFRILSLVILRTYSDFCMHCCYRFQVQFKRILMCRNIFSLNKRSELVKKSKMFHDCGTITWSKNKEASEIRGKVFLFS